MKTRKSKSKDELNKRDFNSRSEESREREENSWQHATDTYNMNYQHILDIPPHIVPKDKVYFWARNSTLGQTDNLRVPFLRRNGWTPVPASRHPELMYHVHDESGYKDGYITVAGSVLYEIDKHTFDKRKTKEDEANMQQLCALPATANFLGGPLPSNIISNETYATRAASFR